MPTDTPGRRDTRTEEQTPDGPDAPAAPVVPDTTAAPA
ncbi:hypothetical protein GA0115247_108917, partial [Streptomyces sp. PalvLS-984]